jgi:hypothetical protein
MLGLAFIEIQIDPCQLSEVIDRVRLLFPDRLIRIRFSPPIQTEKGSLRTEHSRVQGLFRIES